MPTSGFTNPSIMWVAARCIVHKRASSLPAHHRLTAKSGVLDLRGEVNREKAGRQRFALIVGEGVVRAAAEITGLSVEHDTANGKRIALEGSLLPGGHPVREAYLGRPDPVVKNSRNPVGYCELAEEQPYLMRPCACGCGEDTDRDFLPGHDVRAIQQRVRDQFDGSPLKLIEFLDQRATNASAAA